MKTNKGLKTRFSEVQDQKNTDYQSIRSRMKKNHKATYIIGSIGIAAASFVIVPKIIDKLTSAFDFN